MTKTASFRSAQLTSSLPRTVTLTNADGSTTEVSIHSIARAMKEEHLACLLESYINGCNGRAGEKVAAYVCRMHRTLQQDLIRFFWQLLTSIPLYTFGTDQRNEAGVTLCRTLADKEEDVYLPLV